MFANDIFKNILVASKIVQLVKALTAKPDDLRIHITHK